MHGACTAPGTASPRLTSGMSSRYSRKMSSLFSGRMLCRHLASVAPFFRVGVRTSTWNSRTTASKGTSPARWKGMASCWLDHLLKRSGRRARADRGIRFSAQPGQGAGRARGAMGLERVGSDSWSS